MNAVPSPGRWARVVVLLLALLVPAAHTDAVAVPAVTVVGEVTEGDLLDTAVRPPGRAVHQPALPQRPVRAPAPALHGMPARPCPAPSWPPYTPSALRSVVLRC
ncbi:hypothetical protein [Streptomyces sp. F001]|uniref:hypothetical protein n=1 Tax=Streptomyces sp. F001 TaxID=1510026 RepID=UPI001F0F4B5A|nr:hypothetical protein [Streptomyces sp. F001]